MAELNFRKMRVAFQGEPGAFSEAAAVQLLGDGIRRVPRTTVDSAFAAIAEGAADGLLVPVENTLAGCVVVRVRRTVESETDGMGRKNYQQREPMDGMTGRQPWH